MRHTRWAARAARIAVTAVAAFTAFPAHAQNDWQYPDPYFGILEIEKSHDGATWRKYRSEVASAPRASRPASPAPAAEPAPATQSAPRPPRNRWKSRWRR
jgi:hypothetical protein